MKKVINASITTAKQPYYGRTMDHVMQGIAEGDDSNVRAVIEDATKATILWGVVNSTPAGATYTLTAGAIYWAGEIYQVDAQTVTVTGANKLVATITTTYQAGDPVTMSDNTTASVHAIRKLVFSDAASGSGDFNFGTIAGVYETAIEILNNLKEVTVVQSSSPVAATAITVNTVSGGPWTYNTDVYKYAYYILHNICYLSFKITLSVTAGAVVDKIRVPLPLGLSKATTGGEPFSQRGLFIWKAPTGTTDYAMGYCNINDDGTEGNRIVCYRNDGAKNITSSVVATELYGQIAFPLL